LVYCTQPYPVLHKRLFPGLEPVTFQSHDNNFTSCAKVTPHINKIKLGKKITGIHFTAFTVYTNLVSFTKRVSTCIKKT
jgi:hypothetical protein